MCFLTCGQEPCPRGAADPHPVDQVKAESSDQALKPHTRALQGCSPSSATTLVQRSQLGMLLPSQLTPPCKRITIRLHTACSL